MMKDYVAEPERLVNVKNLDRTIARTPDGGLRIGSAVTLAELAAHADVQRSVSRAGAGGGEMSGRRRSATSGPWAAT